MEGPVMNADYPPLEEMEKTYTTAAEDRGIARDVRDLLIGETDAGEMRVNDIKVDTDIGVGKRRLARIVDTHDWFVETEIDGSPAIRITHAGHVALLEDDHRDYEGIAGRRFDAASNGVIARGD
jgi:hypothetical protein